MTQAEFFSLGGFIILILGAVGTAWWRMESKIERAKTELNQQVNANSALSQLTHTQLAEYRTHVAETFATKQGQKEQTDTMLLAINGIRTDIKGLNDRIDRIFEAGNMRSRSRSGNN